MMNKNEALELLKEYNKEEFHLAHGQTVSGCMEYFANKLGYADEAEYWAVVGLLHDIDFEMWPEEHCVKCVELLEKAGFDEKFIHAVTSHGWGMTNSKAQPELEMEKILFAIDELTGLIGAAALMRPSKSCADMELKSLKKKYKDKKFAAKCNRELIQQGCDMLGMDVREVAEICIQGMKPHAAELQLAGTEA